MSDEKQNDKKPVRCPICKKEVPFDDPNMPFCSDRCRVIDLGNWASEAYVVPGGASKTDVEDEFSDGE